MTDTFLSVSGHRATSASLVAASFGVWFADVEFDELVTVTGATVATLGQLELHGTVDPLFSGSFGLKSRMRLVGGALGWRNIVAAKHFHNDAGVKASTVLQDAARLAGETLDLPAALDSRVGVDFVRPRGPASTSIERLFGRRWYVGFDGVTRVGARADLEVTSAYDLLDYDPRQKIVTLAIDDVRGLGVGSILRARLDRPIRVQSLEIDVQKGELRVRAWGEELAA